MKLQCPKCNNIWSSSAEAKQPNCLMCNTKGIHVTGKSLIDLRKKQASVEKKNRRLYLQ